MGKFATKDMAEEAKRILEQQLYTPNQPKWLKSIELETDDHGYYLAIKIKNKQEYSESAIQIPSVINVDGFNLKNCILLLG